MLSDSAVSPQAMTRMLSSAMLTVSNCDLIFDECLQNPHGIVKSSSKVVFVAQSVTAPSIPKCSELGISMRHDVHGIPNIDL